MGSNPEISLAQMVKNKQINENEVRSIACSEPIPNSPFTLRKSLPANTQAAIRKAFADLKDINFAEYGTIAEFKTAKDSDYDVIREVARLLKLDPKTAK